MSLSNEAIFIGAGSLYFTWFDARHAADAVAQALLARAPAVLVRDALTQTGPTLATGTKSTNGNRYADSGSDCYRYTRRRRLLRRAARDDGGQTTNLGLGEVLVARARVHRHVARVLERLLAVPVRRRRRHREVLGPERASRVRAGSLVSRSVGLREHGVKLEGPLQSRSECA